MRALDDDLTAAIVRQHTVGRFLTEEAACLDEWRLRDWLAMLTDDVVYQVPVRIQKEVTDARRVTGVMTDSFHMDENRASLEMRVDRIDTGFAWAEEPPTRTRHLIGNVRVDDGLSAGLAEGDLAVRSNLLLYHTRWDRPDYHVLSADRHDVLRPTGGGGWRLARRLVVLDNTVIPVHNMSFFF